MFLGVLVCFGVFWCGLVCFGVCSGVYFDVSWCAFGVFWCVSVYFGVCTKQKSPPKSG